MEAAAWGPVWDLRVRFGACGHTELRSKVPFQSNVEVKYRCPVCEAAQDVDHPQFVSRDFIPTRAAGLRWGLAKKTRLLHEKAFNIKV